MSIDARSRYGFLSPSVVAGGGLHGVSGGDPAAPKAAPVQVQGAPNVGYTGCITIECPTCGLTRRVDREPYDPKQAHRCEIKCPECIGSDFEQTFYFDENGRELVSDDGQNWRVA